MQHAFLILRANFSHFFRKATVIPYYAVIVNEKLLLPNKVVIVINLVAGITVVIHIVRLWDVVAVVI